MSALSYIKNLVEQKTHKFHHTPVNSKKVSLYTLSSMDECFETNKT